MEANRIWLLESYDKKVLALDKRTRGRIEKDLDELLKSEMNYTESARWLLDALEIVRSPEEAVLSYWLGSLMRYCREIVRITKIHRGRKVTEVTAEDDDEIRDMLRYRIPDLREIINIELNM